jgi:hypothetical protein
MVGMEELLSMIGLGTLGEYTFNIIAALIVLVIGWIIGKILGKVTKSILKKLNADKYFKFGRGFEVSKLFPLIVSWIIYLWFIRSAVGILGVPELTMFFVELLVFLPKLLEAMIVILVGYLLAKYVQGQVIATKAEYSEFIGRVIFFFTIIIAIDLALPLVGIRTEVIDGIILILFASVGLGIAIALGLGLKDTVAKVAKKYAKKL